MCSNQKERKKEEEKRRKGNKEKKKNTNWLLSAEVKRLSRYSGYPGDFRRSQIIAQDTITHTYTTPLSHNTHKQVEEKLLVPAGLSRRPSQKASQPPILAACLRLGGPPLAHACAGSVGARVFQLLVLPCMHARHGTTPLRVRSLLLVLLVPRPPPSAAPCSSTLTDPSPASFDPPSHHHHTQGHNQDIPHDALPSPISGWLSHPSPPLDDSSSSYHGALTAQSSRVRRFRHQ